MQAARVMLSFQCAAGRYGRLSAHKYAQVGGGTSSKSGRSSLSDCSMLSSKAFGKCLLMRPRNNLHTIAINIIEKFHRSTL
jgi:hypothetical protein